MHKPSLRIGLTAAQAHHFSADRHQFPGPVHVRGICVGRLHGPATFFAFFVSIENAVLTEVGTGVIRGVVRKQDVQGSLSGLFAAVGP